MDIGLNEQYDEPLIEKDDEPCCPKCGSSDYHVTELSAERCGNCGHKAG